MRLSLLIAFAVLSVVAVCFHDGAVEFLGALRDFWNDLGVQGADDFKNAAEGLSRRAGEFIRGFK